MVGGGLLVHEVDLLRTNKESVMLHVMPSRYQGCSLMRRRPGVAGLQRKAKQTVYIWCMNVDVTLDHKFYIFHGSLLIY